MPHVQQEQPIAPHPLCNGTYLVPLITHFALPQGRLCMTKDTLFYGRVMLLISRFFDMFDRSALNLPSEVNQVYLTSWSQTEVSIETKD